MKKKFMAAFLAVCMIATMLVIPVNAASFPDTDGHWAASSIERWSDAKVLNGNADGTFNPDGTMTRAEYVKFLAENLLGYSAKAENVFTDVPAGSWYEDAVLKAVAAGVTTGTSATTFGPTNAVTFEQAAVLMFRALGLVKVVGGSNYADDTNKLLVEMEITDTEHVNANGDCTRAVVAAIADRVIGEYVTSDTVIDKDVKGVVVAVNGAKVEIKDATVSASIVAADGASVTLTNATAGNVVVGDKATVTADEKSTVKDVTMIGEAPKADIKGSVDSLTVGETATGAVADVPAGTTTENKSSSEATINGETVGGDDSNETPDNTAKDPELGEGAIVDGGSEVSGTKPGAHTHVWTYDGTATTYTKTNEDGTTTSGTAVPEGNHVKTCTVCGLQEVEKHGAAVYTYTNTQHTGKCPSCNKELVAATSHVMNEKNTACTVCDFTQKVTAGNHTGDVGTAHDLEQMTAVITTAATCTEKGTHTYTCKQEGCGYKIEIDDVPALGHTVKADTVTIVKAATCVAAGEKTYTCSVCNKTIRETIPATGTHTYVIKSVTSSTHVRTCTGCGRTEGSATGCTFTYTVNGGGHIGECSDCGNKTATEAHDFSGDPAVDNEAHTKTWTCTKSGCTATKTESFTPESPDPDPDESEDPSTPPTTDPDEGEEPSNPVEPTEPEETETPDTPSTESPAPSTSPEVTD